jgi:hypothetical protein
MNKWYVHAWFNYSSGIVCRNCNRFGFRNIREITGCMRKEEDDFDPKRATISEGEKLLFRI